MLLGEFAAARDLVSGPPVAIAASLAAPHGLTARASAFDRRDVVRAWAEARRDGASAEVIERLADDWLHAPDAARLDSGRRREQFGGARYSTVEMLRIESRLLEHAAARRSAGAAAVNAARVEARLRATDHGDRAAARVRVRRGVGGEGRADFRRVNGRWLLAS